MPSSDGNINTTMHPDANDAILVLTRECQGAGTTVQIMTGFAPKFRTPEDYIIGITYDIWEGGGLGLIESDYYAATCPVYTPLSVSYTAQEVTAGTRSTLAEFPDRNLLADDIIVGAKRPGFYSSHRVRSVATHLGPGRFAPPSGRSLTMLTIADCQCRDNRIVEEWLVRDQAGIARQVGRDPRLLGYELGRTNPAAAAPGVEALLARWADANGQTVEGDKTLAAMALSAMTAIWGAKEAGAVERHYDRSVRMEAPGSELHYGVYADPAIYRQHDCSDPRWNIRRATHYRHPSARSHAARRCTLDLLGAALRFRPVRIAHIPSVSPTRHFSFRNFGQSDQVGVDARR